QPLAVARVARERLHAFDGRGWEYWSSGEKQSWTTDATRCVPLFSDGAPEMTVGRVRGIDGFVATYTSLGLGPNIVVRHAARPEGPWSDALTVYRCPEAEQKLLLYGAKAHAELATADKQLIITYSRNAGSLKADVEQPEIYFPQAIAVQLR